MKGRRASQFRPLGGGSQKGAGRRSLQVVENEADRSDQKREGGEGGREGKGENGDGRRNEDDTKPGRGREGVGPGEGGRGGGRETDVVPV